MSATISVRHGELLASLYTGEPPAWMPRGAVEQFGLAADKRRLNISRRLGVLYPRAAYYADAVEGGSFLDGVCAALVDLPRRGDVPTGHGGDFLALVSQAVERWLERRGSTALDELFAYDRWIRAYDRWLREVEDGRRVDEPEPGDHASSREAEVVTVREFQYDVLEFGRLLDDMRFQFAPRELVARYEPVPRRQVLEVFADGGLRVREADAALAVEAAEPRDRH